MGHDRNRQAALTEGAFPEGTRSATLSGGRAWSAPRGSPPSLGSAQSVISSVAAAAGREPRHGRAPMTASGGHASKERRPGASWTVSAVRRLCPQARPGRLTVRDGRARARERRQQGRAVRMVGARCGAAPAGGRAAGRPAHRVGAGGDEPGTPGRVGRASLCSVAARSHPPRVRPEPSPSLRGPHPLCSRPAASHPRPSLEARCPPRPALTRPAHLRRTRPRGGRPVRRERRVSGVPRSST